jgi:ABC-2 type transport system ATP-binding protein
MPVATITDLTVRYGKKIAVDGLTVEIPEGCVGLLGPNGAGKTTLLKTLLGFLNPSSGSGEVLGLNVATDGLKLRQKIGLMPEIDCHIPGMNAVTFVAFCGEMAGMPAAQALRRAHETLQYCRLGEARYRNLETYSTGMKQKVKLAQALVHGPKLLFLDEPTNGLDPEGRDEMLNLVRDVSHGKGLNVVVSSHLMPDIERTCDTVVVMRQGKMVRQGSIDELRAVDTMQYTVDLREPSPLFQAQLEAAGAALLHNQGSHYRFEFKQRSDADIGGLFLRIAQQTGAQVRGFEPAIRSLEEVFMEAIA